MHNGSVSDDKEARVPDVGGVEFEVGMRKHHDAGRTRPDDLLLLLLHLTESLKNVSFS